MDLDPTLSYTLTVVREVYDEDNDVTGTVEWPMAGVRLAARMPQPDAYPTGERITAQYDARHPDRTVDLRGTDRIRLPGEPTNERARWTVEGEPARSPWPDGGTLFVIQRQRG